MKANELQIGDWVSERNCCPMQVTGFYEDVAYLDFDGNECDCWEVKEEDILPVPLTPKILEFNGFYSILVGNERVYSIGKGFTLRFVDKKAIINYCGEYILTIDSVHKLQHFIKDFGIKMEIRL